MKPQKLKIMHVIFSLSSGGAERVVLNLCNEQVRNHDVILLTILEENEQNSFYQSQLDERVKFINLNSKKGIQLSNFFKVNRIINNEQPLVVHYHLNTILYGIWPAFKKRVKSIHTLHNVAQLTLGFYGQKWINKWLYKTNRIQPVALSNECAESITDVYGLKEIPIVLNGVPKYSQSIEYLKATNFMNQFKTNKESLVYVHVARYNVVQKNQELLFSAFNELIAENKNIHLVIIGRDYPVVNFPNIHFLGEMKNPLDYVCNADAMVLSSFNEGIPMSVLEGFSCGIPVVSTPAGGMKDILSNEKFGMLSKDFSTESFKETLSSMAERIRGNNYPKQEIVSEFERQYSIDSCSQSYINIYTSK